MSLDVWIANLEAAQSLPPSDLRLLDDADIARWKRLRKPDDRRRHLLARVVLRKALSCALGGDPADWRFETPAGGKPRLSAEHDLSEVDFSISHSGNAVVVCVSPFGEIGADVERIALPPPAIGDGFGLLDSVFSERELDHLEEYTGIDRWQTSLRMWTMKEAYAKLIGVDRELEVFEDVEVAPEPWRILSREPVALETYDLEVGGEPYHLSLASRPLDGDAPSASARLRRVG